MLKKNIIFFLSILISPLYSQCVDVGVINSQNQIDSLSGCEIFQGNLVLSGSSITDLSSLSSLSVVSGSLYLLNTSVTDLSPLSSLNSAQQVIVQGNTFLSSCCEFLQFIDAAQLGSIMNVSLSNNGACDDIEAIMLDCLGYIEGCTDIDALNFSENATVDNGSCEYFCPESNNDIIDYSCNGNSYPYNCEAQIINEPSDGAGHYNNPVGLCYNENPPSSGPHRPMWGRWGEYEYMPPQRYIHNLEHGGIAILYHPCVEKDLIDSLRTLACSRADDDGGEFRWILTPYVDLPTNIAVVAWEWTYLNDCFDLHSINNFIDEHYRNAPEDFYYNGTYDTLYTGKCEAYGCADVNALNFESNSLIDDGSCIYPELDTQLVILNQGWSLFSTYINPLNDSINTIFQNISEQTIIVKNNFGAAYLPDWNYNGIGVLDSKQGYQVKLTSNSVLQLIGIQVAPELTPIELLSEWNMIAYLREESADVILVFQDVVDHIIILKDGLGNVYYPAWNFSNISGMFPGEGYQIKMSASDTLQYLSNEEEY